MRKVGSLAIVAVFAMLGLALFNTPHAAADGVDGPYIDQAFVGRLQDYDSKGIIMSCLLQADDNRPAINSTAVQGGQWFGSVSKGVRVSYFTDVTDGLLMCNSDTDVNGARTKSLVTGMGWSTPIQAACALGAKSYYTDIVIDQTTGEMSEQGSVDLKCGDGAPDGKTAMFKLPNRNTSIDSNKNAQEALSDLIDSQKKYAIKMVPELRYVGAWEAFRMGCKAKTGASGGAIVMKDMTSATDINGNPVDIAGTLAVRIVGKELKVDIVRFKVPSPSQRVDMFLLDPNNGNGVSLTCSEIANDMSGTNSANYLKAVKNLPELNGYKAPGDPSAGGTGESQSTCNVEGIGWIICPVMTFIAGVNDSMYGFLSNTLQVKPSIFGKDSSEGLYGAWNIFRGYANVLFIIAFLFIVYSQITSAGIANYGVKKLLPKLIIAAILVNVSYYLCQIAVDLSNILGFGLKSIFDSIGGAVGEHGTAGSAETWQTAIAGILIGATAFVGLALAISVPTILAGLLALAMVALILIARQAFIILLIAISPLAFVAYLLPNTEKWFKKWWEMFFSMLMLYPIISVLFGAGALAASILGKIDFGDDGGAAKMAALAATIIPLFATIPLLQNALKATGAVGAKLNGWSSAANKRIGSKVKTDSRLGRGWNAALNNREKKRRISQDRRNAGNRVTRGAFGALGGRNYNAQLQANAVRDEKAEYEEVVKSATDMQAASMNHDQILAAASSGEHDGRTLTDHERDAAVRYAMSAGSFTERRDVLHGAHSMTREQRKSAVGGARTKGDGDVYGQAALSQIENNVDAAGNPAYTTRGQVSDVLDNATTARLENGSISVPAMTKDAHTARYVASRAYGSTAAQTRAHDDVDNYGTHNPQEWAAVNGEVRGILTGF